MDEKTRTALEGSIAKWQAIVDGAGKDLGTFNCPLCDLFYAKYNCDGCPVMEKTGQTHCRGTPYDYFDPDEDGTAQSEIQRKAAQAELDFLKSLLPKV